jgi:peptide/nickel transport system ATP-binding protein
MLNPLQTAGRHIAETLRGAGATPPDLRGEVLRRLREVGIHDEQVADRYPFQLSGGMRQRIGIASALARDCRVLAADEPATALDVTTQRDILALLKRLQRDRGMGLILVTHDLRVAFAVCDRIYVLYAGALMEVAAPAALQAEPLHPYSLGLMLSDPPLDRRLQRLSTIGGSVPRPDDVAGGCAFAPRCRWAAAGCVAGRPRLAGVAPTRLSACLRLPEIACEMRIVRTGAERHRHLHRLRDQPRSCAWPICARISERRRSGLWRLPA